MKDALWFRSQTDVSRETLDRLTTYADLLVRWNPRINLVGRRTIADLWQRHFLDSAQLIDLVPAGPVTWADLGSGAGFPGLVIALMRPETAMTLVESDQRKAAFLTTAIRATEASAHVVSERLEAMPGLNAQVLSARALAPLTDLLTFAHRHLAPGGTALFPKGAAYAAECEDALEHWTYHCETHPSKTDPAAVILELTEIQRAQRPTL